LASILMAFDDVGLAVRLQETLEGAGNDVDWNASLAGGPGEDCQLTPDLVLLSGNSLGARAEEVIEQWRDLDPPPAILVMGSSAASQQLAYEAKASFLEAGIEGPELIDAVMQAMSLRFAGRLSYSFARGALELVAGPGDADDALRILMGSRNADLNTVRASLRWYAYHYVAANELIAELRKHRALQIPEVEFSHLLDGARTVRTALQQTSMDGTAAARCLWALASIGALGFSVEPPDMSTVKRRAVTMSREHLRARREYVANKTYYDVLEVTRDATVEEIDQAARMLSVRYSPKRLDAIDLGDCAPLVDQTWKEIYDAHHVLRDERLRYRYD
jgi:hypothetical protein